MEAVIFSVLLVSWPPPPFLAASGSLGRGTFIYCLESSACRVNTAWLVEQGTTCCFLSHTHMNPQMHSNTRTESHDDPRGLNVYGTTITMPSRIDSHRRRDKLTQTSTTLKPDIISRGGVNCYNGREDLSLLGGMTGPTPIQAGSCLWQEVTAFTQVSVNQWQSAWFMCL